ncbi:MAG: YdcF family protein [Butyricicoccus sp.]
MDKREVKIWMVLAVVFGVLGGACFTWEPIRFGTAFLGTLAVGCAGEAIMVARADENPVCRRVAVLGRVLFGLFLASFFAIQGLILSGERTDQAIYDAEYVLVLGAHIYDDRPSAALQSRLDVAAKLLEENSDAKLVLCGGQGPDEIMPEAHMMYDYLVKKGVPEGNLLVEDESNNTIQNIANAKAEFDLAGKKTAVITSEFHLARARRLMEQAGLENAGMPAPTPYVSLRLVCHLREYCSTLGLIVTGRYF